MNEANVSKTNLVEFAHDSELVHTQAHTDALILLCHAKPYNEPVVSVGPFVMNTEEEIHQAYRDFRSGNF